jgi:putative tricarboxylic transport membrane protein
VGSLFLLGVLVFWDTYRVEQPAFNLTVSPKVFPYAISFFLMILSLILSIKILKGDLATPEGLTPEDEVKPSDFKTFGVVLGSFIAFLLLVERAGFVVAASVTFFGITVAFGDKKHLKTGVFGTIFIFLVYMAFTKFLNVPLPAGILKGI